MSLLDHPPVYKPFKYPWCYDAWLQQQHMHWLPEEVPMDEDIKDWKYKLNDSERNFLTQIFRFFTQSDIEVNNCYMRKYASIFRPTEVCMMLTAFSNMETIHIAAYAHLVDTLNMPETTYSEFLEYKEMSDKYDYLQKYTKATGEVSTTEIAIMLALFGAFTEGLSLFASFSMLLNFQRFNKMKGMCQIVDFSLKDESLHVASVIKLFHTFVDENPEVYTQELIAIIYQTCHDVVKMEDAFIDLAFGMGDMEGLTAVEVKNYIRYIANRRITQLKVGKVPFSDIVENPLPWMDEITSVSEHTNFFEQRATEYSKGATSGDWSDAFGE